MKHKSQQKWQWILITELFHTCRSRKVITQCQSSDTLLHTVYNKNKQSPKSLTKKTKKTENTRHRKQSYLSQSRDSLHCASRTTGTWTKTWWNRNRQKHHFGAITSACKSVSKCNSCSAQLTQIQYLLQNTYRIRLAQSWGDKNIGASVCSPIIWLWGSTATLINKRFHHVSYRHSADSKPFLKFYVCRFQCPSHLSSCVLTQNNKTRWAHQNDWN